MTGKECFETDFTPSGIADRKSYRTWEELPLPLKRWWNDRAQLPEFGGPIDWNEIKRAVAQEG